MLMGKKNLDGASGALNVSKQIRQPVCASVSRLQESGQLHNTSGEVPGRRLRVAIRKALAVRRDTERFGAAKGIELSTVAKNGCGMPAVSSLSRTSMDTAFRNSVHSQIMWSTLVA